MLSVGHAVEHTVEAGRRAWVHVVRGTVLAADITLSAGDALATDDAGTLALTAEDDAEVLLFDLP